ncbi:MAG: hypothetical protein VW865_08435 [Halieaceae bacterium]
MLDRLRALGCLLVSIALCGSEFAYGAEESSSAAAQVGGKKESPWLLTPLLSVDPKLGRNVGALAAYTLRFDDDSPVSMLGTAITYSSTDSYVGGVFADLYWQQDRNRLSLGAGFGKIRNDYDDFLGSGVNVKTVDNFDALFLRYVRRIGDSPWFIGGLVLNSNYQIDFPPRNSAIADQIGYLGFDATGAGIVFNFDTRDDVRNPTRGTFASVYNVAYRGSDDENIAEPIFPGLQEPILSPDKGDANFDVYHVEARTYLHLNLGFAVGGSTLALEVKNRLTDDAPLSGYSSISLPGYTKGNYLGQNYSHLQFDLRLPLGQRWGAVVFGGVGCLYGDGIGGDGISCGENSYPALGAGVSYLIKADSGIVVRAEVAKGSGDNSALYLRFGHPF